MLCHLAEGCSFFNFVPKFQECSLKYGVGKQKEKIVERIVSGSQNKDSETYFGPKFCPDDCNEPQLIAERNVGATLSCTVSCRLGDRNVIVPAASIGKVCGDNDGPRMDQPPPSTSEGSKVDPKIVNSPPSSTSNTLLQDSLKSSGQRQTAFIASGLVFCFTTIVAIVFL